MGDTILWWVRRDLRLADNPALSWAAARGPVVPVYVDDPTVTPGGAAPAWRLAEGLRALDAALRARGSRLLLRRGGALETLRRLAAETSARGVAWNRLYDGAAQTRDAEVKAALRADGLEAESFAGHLLAEPWEVKGSGGDGYRVFTPFWRALRSLPVAAPMPAPRGPAAPSGWPASEGDALDRMGRRMARCGPVLSRHVQAGEAAARARLDAFLETALAGYGEARDRLDLDGTSGLSAHLSLGEIGVRAVWHAAMRPREAGAPGAEPFLRQLAWRDFAWHLFYRNPAMDRDNWRPDWDAFPWRGDNDDAERWRRGMTGEPLVDAGMRQMYATGWMHNRARLVAASYLTKHLLTDWRVGLRWFEECLADWDPANNALGWQWVAGSGPDAAPFFRIFNPALQARRFDPEGAYVQRHVAELSPRPAGAALDFFEAAPRAWRLDAARGYPAPVIDLVAGRDRALSALRRASG